MNALSPFLAAMSFGKLAAIFAISMIVYPIALAIYRLAFSKLAGFPGPKIAAATGWYEFYYDFFCRGKFLFEIERMHRNYGSFLLL